MHKRLNVEYSQIELRRGLALNTQNIKYFYEIRALLTLKALFAEKMESAVHSDSPDIHLSDTCGIEVTRCTDNEDQKAFFDKYLQGKSISSVEKSKIYNFEKHGNKIFEYNGQIGGYIPEAKWHSTGNIINTIEKKIDKLNKSSYAGFVDIDLYVFSDSFDEYDIQDLKEITSVVISYQNTKSKKYNKLYFDDEGLLFECDLNSGEIYSYDIHNIIHNICVQAWAEAEKK